MTTKQKTFIEKINLSRVLAFHLIGEKHTKTHRRLFGIAIMFSGIGIAQLTSFLPVPFIHFLGETAGAAIHGIGLIPFLPTDSPNC